MTGFCVDTITLDKSLRANHGVLRVKALAVTADARIAAQRIMENAREEAAALLKEAREEAAQLTGQAEEQTLQRADELLEALANANETFLARAQDMIIGLGQGLFDRLVMETTPREKIEAALKRVQTEAPPKLVSALLRVHPDDMELLPQIDWDTKADASLTPGTCRLEASDGEWCANFTAAVAALNAAFKSAVETNTENEDETDSDNES